MNDNNIRNVMGKENAGTISPATPVLDSSTGRRKSVAYTNDRIKEMILKAPFIETADEGDGDREPFASELSLWMRDVVVPDMRKEVLSESEKAAQQAVRVVQTEMESVLGRGSPEESSRALLAFRNEHNSVRTNQAKGKRGAGGGASTGVCVCGCEQAAGRLGLLWRGYVCVCEREGHDSGTHMRTAIFTSQRHHAAAAAALLLLLCSVSIASRRASQWPF
jgi:hypothetical protein